MPIRTGQRTIATAGTELPLLGFAYSTGTVTTTAGSKIVTGVGTTWNTTNIAGFGEAARHFFILTAGGNLYEIAAIVSTTKLELKQAVDSAESGVAYDIYERPQTASVVLTSKQTTTTQLMYVGVKGVISNAVGLAIAPAVIIELPIDLHSTDLWVDASGNGQVLSFLLEV